MRCVVWDWKENALHREGWRSLCPFLSMKDGSGDDPAEKRAKEIEPSAGLDAWRAELWEDGFCRMESVLPGGVLLRLARGVAQVREKTGSAVFALLYDEPWELLRRLWWMLEELCGGDDLRVVPRMWVWYLPPSEGAQGWAAHRDHSEPSLRKDGSPNILTVWIPLTDATPQNGCIYALSADADPGYAKAQGHRISEAQWQSIQAIPAKQGDVLCWNHHLLHWGGRSSSQAKQPRISLAFEVQRNDAPPMGTPLLEAGRVLSFKERLGLVSLQLLRYEKYEPLPPGTRSFLLEWSRWSPQKRTFAEALASAQTRKKRKP